MVRNLSSPTISDSALRSSYRVSIAGKYLGSTTLRITRSALLKRLCNTKATSKQALLIHADGKKHRAKARAFHASKQPPLNDTAETKSSTENNAKDGVTENKDSGESGDEDPSKVANNNNDDTLEPNKKRKHEASENGGAQHKAGSADLGNDQVIEIKGSEKEKVSKKAKRSATQENVEPVLAKKKIQWKKLITSSLKSNEDGSMKLKKFVLKSLNESGFTEDKKQMLEILAQKVNSSSKFLVDGKFVRLAASQHLRIRPHVLSDVILYSNLFSNLRVGKISCFDL